MLDRAITFQNINSKKEIDDTDIRNMLGLADKSKVINLLKEIFKGNSIKAVTVLKDLFSHGIEARYFLNDILEVLSLMHLKMLMPFILLVCGPRFYVRPCYSLRIINLTPNKEVWRSC